MYENFKLSTYQTWLETIPPTAYKENKQEKTFKIRVGNQYSTIHYGGLNRTEDTDKFKSTEFSFQYWDQAEELTENDFLTVLPRNRQKLPNGTYPPYQAFFSANPQQCAFRNRFIMNPKAGNQKFVQMLAKDNPWLAPDYIPKLQEIYKYRPELIRALLEGDWNVIEAANMIFRQAWIDASMQYTDVRRFTNKKGVSIDAARFGDDETAIYGWHGTKQVEKDIFGKRDENSVAAAGLGMLKRIGGNWIAVGGGAIGETVISKLKLICDNDVQIILVDEKMPAMNPSKFYNIRAEMYWLAAELMCENGVSLIPDAELSKQFLAQTYGLSGGRILVDPKDKIKELLNRSPDYSDATVIGLWALHSAPEMPAFASVQLTSTQKAIRDNAAHSQNRNVQSYYDQEQ